MIQMTERVLSPSPEYETFPFPRSPVQPSLIEQYHLPRTALAISRSGSVI